MKKFLPLLLLLLAPVWAAPLAEAATKPVNSEADLKNALLSLASEDITEIVVNSDITLTAELPEVSPDAELTIKGSAKTIDGGGKPIFKVMKGKVVFQGLTLTKGTRAVHAANGTDVKFDAVTFAGNGGAVKVDGGAKAEFTGGTKFQNNSAADGGAVHAASGADVKFDAVTFDGNKATVNGGAVYAEDGSDVKFGAATFTGNSAKDGGAIYVKSGVLTLPEGVKLTTNNATDNGGAVALGPTAMVRFANKEITRNHAKNGGAVHAPAGSKLEFTSDFSFANNSADEGGAIHAQALTLNPESHKLTFEDNRSKGKGGAVYVSESVTVNGNVTFRKNGTDGSGGAVYSDKDVTLQKAAFTENSSGKGGAVYAKGVVIGDSSTFSGNTATDTGGAVYSEGRRDARSRFSDTLFENNSAGDNGGALYVGDVDISKVTFENNKALKKQGGAIFFAPEGIADIQSAAFDENHANDMGGALYVTGDQFTLKITQSVFTKNYANGATGGAIHAGGKVLRVLRSTFEENSIEGSGDTRGGAIYSSASATQIANCTFWKNKVPGGNGGAVALGKNVGTDPSALIYGTFVNNEAGSGNGGALSTEASALYMMGCVLVGNAAAHGADVFGADGTIFSKGYNVIGGYGEQGSSGPADNVDWAGAGHAKGTREDRCGAGNTAALCFGANVPAENGKAKAAGSASKPYDLNTIKPRPSTADSANPLLDAIPQLEARKTFGSYPIGDHTDERGVDRNNDSVGKCDIGAYENGETSNDPDNPGGLGGLASIRISGVPNTLTSIGQTASLVAEAYDQGGKRIAAPVPVTWSSSNTGVAHIDDNGNLVALSLGTTVIRATTKSNSMNGSPATDSVTLTVDKDVSDYLNIHPRIWQQLGIYNEAAASSGSTLAFADVNPALVQAGAFQTAFRGAWSANASQITKLGASAPISVKSASGFSIDGYTAEKPGASLILGGRKKGEVLALLYRWSFNWETLSKLLGRKVTEAPSVSELFKALRVDFVPAAGATGWNVIGAGGVSAQDAAAKGALKLVRGNNGVTVALTAYLANVGGAAPSGARLMNGLLVVPDGTADASVGGTMWISQRVASSGGGSKGSGEGGGGCSLGLVGALGLTLAGFLLRRR